MVFYNCKENPPEVGLRYLVQLKDKTFTSADYFKSTNTWYNNLEYLEVIEPELYTLCPNFGTPLIISKKKNSFIGDPLEMIIFGLERLGFWWSFSLFLLFTTIVYFLGAFSK